MPELVSNGSRLEEGRLHHMRLVTLASCLVFSSITPACAQASSAAHKQVEQLVDERAANWKQVSKQIWDYAELGYHERQELRTAADAAEGRGLLSRGRRGRRAHGIYRHLRAG